MISCKIHPEDQGTSALTLQTHPTAEQSCGFFVYYSPIVPLTSEECVFEGKHPLHFHTTSAVSRVLGCKRTDPWYRVRTAGLSLSLALSCPGWAHMSHSGSIIQLGCPSERQSDTAQNRGIQFQSADNLHTPLPSDELSTSGRPEVWVP